MDDIRIAIGELDESHKRADARREERSARLEKERAAQYAARRTQKEAEEAEAARVAQRNLEETLAQTIQELKTKEKEAKPVEKPKKISQAEFEKKVIELADKGLTSEKIGEELRGQRIHPKEYSGTISQILKKSGKYVNPDLKNVEAKLERVKTHYAKNKQDKRAMREKDRFFAQLRKLKKYFQVE